MPSDLHEIFRSAAARPSEPLNLENALRRGLRRRRTRRFGVAATFLALIIGSAVVARLPLAERDGSARPSQPTQSDADINPHVSAKVAVGPTPEVIDVAAAGVWVSLLEDEMSNEGFSLATINAETHDAEARVPVDIPIDHLGVGEGALWATGFDKELQKEVL